MPRLMSVSPSKADIICVHSRRQLFAKAICVEIDDHSGRSLLRHALQACMRHHFGGAVVRPQGLIFLCFSRLRFLYPTESPTNRSDTLCQGVRRKPRRPMARGNQAPLD